MNTQAQQIQSNTINSSNPYINEEHTLIEFVRKNEIRAEHLRFSQSLHSVSDVLNTTDIDLELVTKTMIFIDQHRKPVAAVIPAKYRVSSSSLGAVLGQPPLRLASIDEAYQATGYPPGGMPCVGHTIPLVIDPKVFEHEFVYTGGGSEFSLLKIYTSELKKLNPIIQKIHGKKSN